VGIADEGAASRIVELLGDPDLWVRFFASRALWRLSEEGSERRARATEVLSRY